MKMYKIVYKGKTLERLATKEVAQNIAEMYRRGQVWTCKKPINVELIEYKLEEIQLCGKSNCNRQKLDGNVYCYYHYDINFG